MTNRTKPTLINHHRRALSLGAAAGGLVSLAGCDRIERLLAPRQPKLPGQRFDALTGQTNLDTLGAKTLINPTVRLTEAVANQTWDHFGSSAERAPKHFGLARAPKLAWSQRIGEGVNRRQRLNASPLIINKTLFVMDTVGLVSARQLDTGRTYWQRSVMPQGETSGFGGGLAYANGRLYVTAGVDFTQCLDARSGEILWFQKLAGVARSTPVVVGNRLYLITLDNRIYCLNADDGAMVWSNSNADSVTRLLGGSSIAVSGQSLIAALGNGEVQSLSTARGRSNWEDTFAPLGIAESALGEIADITAPPSIYDGSVYITTQAGRTASVNILSGKLNWEASFGGRSFPSFSGKHMFVTTEQANVIAVDIDSGRSVWVKDLPRYRYETTRRGYYAWHGPTLAGNRLFISGENQNLVSLNPITGQFLGERDMNSDIITPPVVASGTMLLQTADGQLHAFR